MTETPRHAHRDLLGGPPPTLLPEEPGADALAAGATAEDAARAHPTSSAAWAALAEAALAGGRDLEAYAYARTGYHRGLDALRRRRLEGPRAGARGSTRPTAASCAP